MPFIDVKTSAKLTEEKIEQIKTELGSSIAFIPGKSEAWLMVNIQDSCNLYFKGNQDGETAYVEVSIFGKSSKDDCEKVTIDICRMLKEIANVPADRTYVKFEFSDMWGYNNFMF